MPTIGVSAAYKILAAACRRLQVFGRSLHTHVHICISIYINREREREMERSKHTHTYICIYVYTYIYIYIYLFTCICVYTYTVYNKLTYTHIVCSVDPINFPQTSVEKRSLLSSS